MPRLPGLRRTVTHQPSAASVRRDVDDEIAFHLDAVTAELVAGGMDPASARREAERRFGHVDRHRAAIGEEDRAGIRRARWRTALEDLVADTRYALRGLRREPLFTLGAILTLGIGLAANTTMFGVVDRLLLRPPAHVRDDGQLHLVYFQKGGQSGTSFVQSSTSWPDFQVLRDSSGVIDQAAAWWTTEASLGRGEAARKVSLGLASGDFFTTLGARPALGRWWAPGDDTRTEAEIPAVLSDAVWRGAFNSDPDVLGRVLQVNQRQVTVVGVAPPGFHGPGTRRVDLWVPLQAMAIDFLGTSWQDSRDWSWIRIVAHRKAEASLATAQARVTAVHQAANRLEKRSDSTTVAILGPIVAARGAGLSGSNLSGLAGLSAQARVAAWLVGVAAVVLLIVCANLANLLLSRAARRRREVAVRLALGVRRGRLVRQYLGETMVLALAAAVVASLLSVWGAAVMRRTLLADMVWDESALDGRLLVFTLGASLVTALLAGLLPAWNASRQDLTGALKASARGGGQRRTAVQRTLLVTQAALSVVLLCGAGLFIRSLRNVATLRMGFDHEQVLVAKVDVSGLLGSVEPTAQFWREALDAVRTVPGVQSAALGVTTPFESSWGTEFHLPGRDSIPELTDGPYINAVTPDWLKTLGTRVVRGRGFQPTDVKGAEPVALVNEHMARLLWPREEALGQCIKVGADTAPCSTVVGITENTIRDNLREQVSPQYFVLQDQAAFRVPDWRSLFIRTSGDPAVVTAAVRTQLQGLRANLPFIDIRTITTIMADHVQPWRLGASMFGVFGAIALVVAAIGLYAVIAYDVTQRWHEFGVRAALGARPSHLLRLILGDGLRHAGLGLVLGIAMAWLLAPLVAEMLFKVPARDVATLAAVSVVLLFVSTLATLVPARRAARLHPREALGGE